MVFDYDITSTYLNILNYKWESCGVQRCYSQILTCKLHSAFQIIQKSYESVHLTHCLMAYGRLGNLSLQRFHF